jgi:hypothetical protein
MVELGGFTAHENHAVHRTRATGQPAARPVDFLSGKLRLGLCLERPDVVRVEQQLGNTERHRHPEILVARCAGFEQQHLAPATLGKAGGQRRAGQPAPTTM